MAYRSWHRDGGRPPPPPYSKHRPGAGAATGTGAAGAGTSNPVPPGDSKFSAELFKDMSKKIAQLTKVICSLSNKSEDQELALQSTKREHEEKVNGLQSDFELKAEEYRSKIKSLEAQLREEQKHTLKKEEEIKTLKHLCTFIENCKFFRDPLLHSSKDKIQTNGAGTSEGIGKCHRDLDIGKNPSRLYLSSRLIFPGSEAPKNGRTEFTFIGNKLRDVESYEEEVRLLIEACEQLKAEKMALQTKQQSDSQGPGKQNSQIGEPPVTGMTDGNRRTSDLSLKEQLEKQDLQYRKRISELLQCLTQSEARAEKYRKEIKQLEEDLSSKDKQNSLLTVELSKTLEHLKATRDASTQIQEECRRQHQEILSKNDLIVKIQNEVKEGETRLSCTKAETDSWREKWEKSQEDVARLQHSLEEKNTDADELQLLKNNLTAEQQKRIRLEAEVELRTKFAQDNHEEEKRKLEGKIETLTRAALHQERSLLQQQEETKLRYQVHLEEERLVHREIQDNLEQQLNLLHQNVQHTIRNEEEEVATLHLLLGDKEASLNKIQKQLKEARETIDRMRRLLIHKEMELEKVRDQQKTQHSTEIIFTVENSLDSDKDKNGAVPELSTAVQETERFLKDRIEFLEEENKILRKEKDEIWKACSLELEAKSRIHSTESGKLKQEGGLNAGDYSDVILKELKENSGMKYPNQTSTEVLQNHADKEAEDYREKCAALQEAMRKLEEDSLLEKEKLLLDFSTEQEEVKKLQSLVQILQEEHGRVIVERELKMNEVLRVRNEASQQIKNLENYWQERLIRELKKASHSFENEKQKLVSHFNKGQRLLKDKIVLLQSIIKDLKDRKLKHESEEENMGIFRELQQAINDKEATISKLKEEKKALHLELLNRRENCERACNQTLTSSVENILGLKKPRLERPPLTPQLVRRHSLLGPSEQKWLRARSQSPMRGFQADPPSKPTQSASPVHRSSWTGESIANLPQCAPQKEDNDTNTTGSAESNKDHAGSTDTSRCQKEQTLENFPVSPHTHEPASNHICDTIAECDELLMSIEEEEKQSSVTLGDGSLKVKDWVTTQIMESEV